jgi:heme-degrading monooxygenase HmoA
LLNQLNYILKAKRITIAGIDEIKEYIRLTVWRDTEDHTNGTNGYKMDMNDRENLKREQEITIIV